jgi:hypothetical protein
MPRRRASAVPTAVADPESDEAGASPGAAEGARLERDRALLDLHQRTEDERADERDESAQSGGDAALGLEPARALRVEDGVRARLKGGNDLQRGDHDVGDLAGQPALDERAHQRIRPGDEHEQRGRAQAEKQARGEEQRHVQAPRACMRRAPCG